MPLYHVTKMYEVEAADENEAIEKVAFMERNRQHWLMLKDFTVKEVPWPKPPEDIEF